MRHGAGSRRRGLVALVACGLVGTLAAGCAAEPTPGGQGPDTSVEVPEPKQPFDVILSKQAGLILHAHLKIRDRCVAAAGYPQLLETQKAQPEDPYAFLTVSARDFGPTSEEEARRMGFGNHGQGEPARVVSTDANFDRAAERCGEQAWKELGPEARQTLTGYTDLVNVLAPYRREVDAELPTDLPARTLECMTRRAYTAPNREEFLKTPNHRLFGIRYGSVESAAEEEWQPARKPGTVEIGPAITPSRYTPTPEESELAVAWFHCGRETGRLEAELAAVQRVQARYVEKHRTWIDELNPKIEELARRAAPIASGS